MTTNHPVGPSTTPTVTVRPRRITPVTVTLILGVVTNMIALATLTTIVLDGPLWLVAMFTVATVAVAAAARQTFRAVPDPRSATAQSAHDASREEHPSDGVQ